MINLFLVAILDKSKMTATWKCTNLTSHKRHKQRVLTPGHQGWNDLHSLCRIGMEYYLLNDNNNDDDHNNNNNNNNDKNDDDNHNNNNNNNNDNTDDASGCFFTNVTFTAVAEISVRGDFFQKLS